MLTFPDTSARDALGVVEAIRRQIETLHIPAPAGEIGVTVSCSVAEAALEDTLPTLLGRVDSTLREAKRFGRNRTYLQTASGGRQCPRPVLRGDRKHSSFE